MADYNARFAKAPANSKDLHRPLRAGDDLDDAFAWKEERTLSQALTLQYDKVIFILEPSEQAKAAIGKRVTVVDYPDGRLSIRLQGLRAGLPHLRQAAPGRPGRRSSRTSGSAPLSPSSASSSSAANPSGAARRHRAAAISATLVSSRSAERSTSRAG